MAINIVKGTHDVILSEARAYEHIEMVLKAVADLYAFNCVRTPIIEHTELFLRSVGESSDIVRKEMYTFTDKGDRSITLRPELTAGVMRAIVSSKLYATCDLPIKSYYLGPAFRYERPQLGRYRQFNQFGIESVGVSSPLHDFEAILLGYDSLRMLGFKKIILKINSLGDEISRANYKEALKSYFNGHIEHMCQDCKERFLTNPLRILDCKVKDDQKIAKNAPHISEYLSEEAKSHFNKIIEMLAMYDIPYELDENLVRGLDYYSHVIFEFHYVTTNGNNLGALGAGGHYDNLVKEIGGPALSGVGLAFGIERLYGVMHEDGLLPDTKESVDVYVMPVEQEQVNPCFTITSILRANAFRTEICLDTKSLAAQFKRAQRSGAKVALIIGPDEVKNDEVVIKNMTTKTQVTIPLNELHNTLEKIFNEGHEHGEDCHCDCHHEE